MDTLATICTQKRAHIAKQKAIIPQVELEAQALSAPIPRGFKRALSQVIAAGRTALIAEIKKASPSKGVIRADFDPQTLAQAYVDGGATCLSVVTDEPYFQGRDSYLAQVKDAVSLPVYARTLCSILTRFLNRAHSARIVFCLSWPHFPIRKRANSNKLPCGWAWMCWSKCMTARNFRAR